LGDEMAVSIGGLTCQDYTQVIHNNTFVLNYKDHLEADTNWYE